ncbi:MAG: sigma-70 family RNA polymerase sigma factor [Chloroflexota bacterium]
MSVLKEDLPSEELVLLCQQTLPHDTRAFEMLVARYKNRVFAVAYRILGSHQDAEDQTQEVFLKVYRGIKKLKEPETLESWLYQITSNTCLDALRQQQRRPILASLSQQAGVVDEKTDTKNATATQPEVAALHHELRWCLEQTIHNLHITQRMLIVLRDIEGRSYDDIATILDIGLSAVKMRIHRARLQFQALLQAICPDVK